MTGNFRFRAHLQWGFTFGYPTCLRWRNVSLQQCLVLCRQIAKGYRWPGLMLMQPESPNPWRLSLFKILSLHLFPWPSRNQVKMNNLPVTFLGQEGESLHSILLLSQAQSFFRLFHMSDETQASRRLREQHPPKGHCGSWHAHHPHLQHPLPFWQFSYFFISPTMHWKKCLLHAVDRLLRYQVHNIARIRKFTVKFPKHRLQKKYTLKRNKK